jgi:hypothetical protein
MTFDIDATIEQAITLKQQIKELEVALDTTLDTLQQAVDAGDLDPSFRHNDIAFDLRPGRLSYTYPSAITDLSLQLKQAQADAIAAGTATAKHGSPFWVIKFPK